MHLLHHDIYIYMQKLKFIKKSNIYVLKHEQEMFSKCGNSILDIAFSMMWILEV